MGGLGVVLGSSGGAGGRPGALSCSVALVFFKNNASHAAWRSFWAAGVPPRGAQEAPRRPPEAPKGPKTHPRQTIKQTNNQHVLYFFQNMLKICWEQSMKHTNKQSNKQKGQRTIKKTHKHSIKQKINQANNQSSTPSIKSNNQRKKTNKPEKETLY